MVFKAVEMQARMNMKGGILMDAPNHANMQELVALEKDKAFWKEHTVQANLRI